MIRAATWLVLFLLLLVRVEASEEFYRSHIKPLLAEKCFACHGALQQKAGLRLDAGQSIHSSGVLNLEHPDESALLMRILEADPEKRMPQESAPLSDEEKEHLRQWVDAGAKYPADDEPESAPEEHWAFQTVVKPTVPSNEASHPIDAFLAVHQERKGLLPGLQADPGILNRRLHLGLTGLLPEDIENRSLNDREWAQRVDELLSTPAYGERWGRHWMDVWRYSDWYGLNKQLRFSSKHLWHWRDWIVESLNADKGYDRMIQEMLAGDELTPEDPDVLRATGFLARNYYLFNRTTWLDGTIEHTSKAFMGLTMNCAKCHDHKYDPLSQEDYYRMRAVFEPHQIRLDSVGGELDFEKDGLPRAFDDQPEAVTHLFIKGDEKRPDKSRVIKAGVPSLLHGEGFKVRPVQLPPVAYAPGISEEVLKAHLGKAVAEVKKAEVALHAAGKNASVREEQLTQPSVLALNLESSEELDRDWKRMGDKWRVETTALVLDEVATDHWFRSRKSLPEDFRAVMRFKTTGGNKWKSVGMRFDVSEDGKNSHTVYASAVNAGQKVQVSHTKDGMNAYPAEGRRTMAISVNEDHTFDIRVKGHRINVVFDGELVVSMRLPRRMNGGLELFVFDATAEIYEVNVSKLDSGFALVDELKAPVLDVLSASADVEAQRLAVLRKAMEVAEANLKTVQAKVDHGRAMRKGASEDELNKLKAEALRLENASAQLEREQKVSDLELRIASTTEAKKKAALNKDLKKAIAARDKKQVVKEFASLAGSLKSLETPEHKAADYPPVYAAVSTGRRLAFANWLVNSKHPLTARVAVNHVWMRHFGEPLVATVEDFGRLAPKPPLQDLLDWLAAEFMESGWSFKHLHRLICTSVAYRRASSEEGMPSLNRERDPENQFYWKVNSTRMESQVLRDVLLQLGGTLDRTMGGASLDAGSIKASGRRSLYFKHSRDDQNPFVSLFDDADIMACYRRGESVVPQQALALSNSQLALEASAAIEMRLFPDDVDVAFGGCIDRLFQRFMGRLPSPDEQKACLEFMSQIASMNDDQTARDRITRRRLIHALLNHNDFITIR